MYSKKEAIEIFRRRQSLVNSLDKIIAVNKSSQKHSYNDGQLTLFDMGMDKAVTYPTIDLYEYDVDIMYWVNKETELLGIPITYDPLWEYDICNEIFCTHQVTDLLELTENTENIVVMDRITGIEYRISKKGNNYCKLHLSKLGNNNYIYLTGNAYLTHISQVFTNSIYLFQLNYKLPTKDYSKESISVTYMKNILYVDIDKEYDRLIDSLEIVDELNEEWQLKNRNK